LEPPAPADEANEYTVQVRPEETMTGKDRTEWNTHRCPNPACTTERWLVKPHPTWDEGWWVVAQPEENPWTVAATTPLCLDCGTALIGHHPQLCENRRGDRGRREGTCARLDFWI
ncbi:MAG: hypothetical protein ACRDIB_12755, partial [Ardenticatenaceae bacterium]